MTLNKKAPARTGASNGKLIMGRSNLTISSLICKYLKGEGNEFGV